MVRRRRVQGRLAHRPSWDHPTGRSLISSDGSARRRSPSTKSDHAGGGTHTLWTAAISMGSGLGPPPADSGSDRWL